jgi:hypothetical protein
VAIFIVIFALLLLSAIAFTLIYSTNTETGVNWNYRQEEIAYFAARAGMEELRDRMGIGGQVPPGPGGIAPAPVPPAACATPPTCLPKENNSVAYGDPAAGGPQNYYSANPVLAATPQGAAQPVCYDGVTERVPPVGVATCAAWANLIPPVYANPVYLVTAMGVTGSGARKVVQAEVGLAPTPPLRDGLFSTSPNCNSLQFVGNAFTDSFNSANGTYAQTVQANGGDIGSLGNIGLAGNANIQGAVNVTGTTYTTTVGPCTAGPPPQNNGVTGNGNNWRDQGLQTLPPNFNTAAAFPPPPAPNPPPPTTTQTYTSNTTLPPGNYGNINVSNGTLTLTPGVYNINSITASGQSNITVSPAGQVVINIGGNGVLPTCTLAQGGSAPCVVSLTGQNVTNTSGISNDFTINYAGNGIVQLAGKGVTYSVVNAPNAALNMSGNGQFFGAALGNTIYYSGNGAFHFDKNAAFRPQSNQNYTMLSFREVAY